MMRNSFGNVLSYGIEADPPPFSLTLARHDSAPSAIVTYLVSCGTAIVTDHKDRVVVFSDGILSAGTMGRGESCLDSRDLIYLLRVQPSGG